LRSEKRLEKKKNWEKKGEKESGRGLEELISKRRQTPMSNNFPKRGNQVWPRLRKSRENTRTKKGEK